MTDQPNELELRERENELRREMMRNAIHMGRVRDAAGLVVSGGDPHALAKQYDREVLLKAVDMLAERKRVVALACYITYELEEDVLYEPSM